MLSRPKTSTLTCAGDYRLHWAHRERDKVAFRTCRGGTEHLDQAAFQLLHDRRGEHGQIRSDVVSDECMDGFMLIANVALPHGIEQCHHARDLFDIVARGKVVVHKDLTDQRARGNSQGLADQEDVEHGAVRFLASLNERILILVVLDIVSQLPLTERCRWDGLTKRDGG